MRKLSALVFHYSLNGLLAEGGTEYFRSCFELLDESQVARAIYEQSLDFFRARTRTSWAVSPTRAWPRPCQRPLTIPGPTS